MGCNLPIKDQNTTEMIACSLLGIYYILTPFHLMQTFLTCPIVQKVKVRFNVPSAVRFVNKKLSSHHPCVIGNWQMGKLSHGAFLPLVKQKGPADTICLPVKNSTSGRAISSVNSGGRRDGPMVMTQETPAQFPALPQTSCVTLGKSLSLWFISPYPICRYFLPHRG